MNVEIQKQENIELNNDNKNICISNSKIPDSNKNSENKTEDCTQKQNKNETNSDNNSKISLNKEQLYETFLLFQNYLSENQKEQIDKKNNETSQFNIGNEELNKNFVTSMQLYKQNNVKKNTEENLNDLKSLDYSKRKRKKFLNESFTLNAKNIVNEYSYDFSNNNTDTYSASIGDSIQFMAYDLLNNKKKLNDVNACNQTTKSKESKNIYNNLNNNKANKVFKKKEIVDYKNKEKELIKNIKKIKVIKSKEKSNKDIKDKNSNREQVIENKIKELNYEITKFKEEKDKVIKIKKEYEKLHTKLMKDIEDLNIKKNNFEKYKEEEINKLKEEKEKLLKERKELNSIKLENQSLNISQKSDKETINHLRNYILELKAIIQKKDKEMKSISQNNKVNNYIINTYKTINTNECINKKSTQVKSHRNEEVSNNFNEENSKEFISNLSFSKINTNFFQNNFSKKSKSNSLININEYSNMDAKKEKTSKNDISLNKTNLNKKFNTSMNIANQKKTIKYMENKNCTNKDKKKINFQNKKTKKNIYLKNKFLKNKEGGFKLSDKFSKTTTNFMQRKKINKEKSININPDKILAFEDEFNKPLNPMEYDFIIPEKYVQDNYTLISKEKIEDKEICLYTKNKKEIIFPSGLKKEIFDDGFQLIYFNNGDIKQSYKDGKKIYFYKDSNTVQTTYSNGINVFKFNNGQIEKHFPNGIKKIFFNNGTIDCLYDENNNENKS